jgi:lycopene elongase/hydratase (dihydrobisanhydrobacterioruberin-forming)
MPDLRFLINVSRPRFWLYVFGPYLVGLAAGAATRDDFLRLDVVLFGLYFLFPANLLVYGVNDIFDFETDRRNPKKAEYELLVRPELHRTLVWVITLLNLPFIAAAFHFVPQALPPLACFLFFSIFYSAPPIRAKAIPALDSVFNILYVFPAAFAYQMLTGSFMPLILFIASGLWTMAMHAYSAIPDIKVDRTAGVSTVATLLGKDGTLAFCLAAYVSAAALAWQYLGYFSIALGAVYAAMILISWFSNDREGIFSIYRRFPIVNAAVGFLLFWIAAFNLFFGMIDT